MRRLVRGRVADGHGDAHEPREVGQLQRLVPGGKVLGGETCDCTRNDVGAVLRAEGAPAAGGGRRRRRGRRTGRLKLGDAARHEVLADRVPHRPRVRTSWTSLSRGAGRFSQDRGRVLVAGLHALEVHDREPAQAVQLAREAHVDDGVHRGGQDRGCRAKPGDREAGVDVSRLHGARTRASETSSKPWRDAGCRLGGSTRAGPGRGGGRRGREARRVSLSGADDRWALLGAVSRRAATPCRRPGCAAAARSRRDLAAWGPRSRQYSDVTDGPESQPP